MSLGIKILIGFVFLWWLGFLMNLSVKRGEKYQEEFAKAEKERFRKLHEHATKMLSDNYINKINIFNQTEVSLRSLIEEVKNDSMGGFDVKLQAHTIVNDILDSTYFKNLLEGAKDE